MVAKYALLDRLISAHRFATTSVIDVPTQVPCKPFDSGIGGRLCHVQAMLNFPAILTRFMALQIQSVVHGPLDAEVMQAGHAGRELTEQSRQTLLMLSSLHRLRLQGRFSNVMNNIIMCVLAMQALVLVSACCYHSPFATLTRISDLQCETTSSAKKEEGYMARLL